MTDLTTLHEELTGVVLVGRTMTAVLTDLTGVARRAMPGAEAVSITLIRDDHPFTAAHDGQLALDADELQYERDYGPCVDAGRSGQMFLVDDMRTELRWPDYARHAADRGVGSSLSVPLPFQSATLGAMNNYATRPHAFTEEDIEVATSGRALGRVRGEPRLGDYLGGGGDRKHVGRHDHPGRDRAGQGHPDGTAQAHAGPGLHGADQVLAADRSKLRDVAEQLVATGALPGAAGRPPAR